jgi:hypothetical protein
MITKTKIQVFVIFLLIVLDLAVFLNGRTLHEDNCIITFKSEPMYQRLNNETHSLNLSVKLTDLYDGFKNGECKVIWTRTQGYVKG